MLDKNFEVTDYSVVEKEIDPNAEISPEGKVVEQKNEEKADQPVEEVEKITQSFHKLDFKIRGEENTLLAKNIVIGSEYHKFVKDVLKIDWELDQTKVKQSLTMHRIAFLVKIEPAEGTTVPPNEYGSKVTDFEKSLPILIQIPDAAADIGNKHPITVLITDYTCQSCPQNFCVMYVDYLVENCDNMKTECTK
jgi:hypothetical protein